MYRNVFAALLVLIGIAPLAGAAKLKVPKDYGTIQAAINAAGFLDVVEVSKGTYTENLTLTGKDGVTVQARKGHKVVIDGGGSGIIIQIDGGSDGVTLSGLWLQNTSGDGIVVVLSPNVVIRNCRIANVGGVGIGIGLATAVTVTRCRISNVGGDGISVGAAGVLVEKTRIMNVSGDGISMVGDTCVFSENRIEGVAGDGIQIGDSAFGALYTLVQGNRIVSSGGDGIALLLDAADCSILDNTIRSSSADGIDVANGSNGHDIAGNVIVRPVEEGIECDSAGCIMRSNRIKKARIGIAIQPSGTDLLLISNRIRKSSVHGIQLAGSGNVLIRNSASGSGTYDFNDLAGPGSNLLIENSFDVWSP